MHIKAPNSVLDWRIDWDLTPDETIASHVATITPTTADIVGDQIAGDVTTIVVGGGSLGSVYEIHSRIITSEGRTDVRSITLRIVTPEAVS